jgi:deoxyribodipyrimidine photo-lyase
MRLFVNAIIRLPMTGQPTILWFRRDLRLADNLSVDFVAEGAAPVIPLFILDEREPYCWDTGGASRWWLHHSLLSLDRSLQELGGGLTLRRGDTVEELDRLVHETNARCISWSEVAGPEAMRLDRTIIEQLGSRLDINRFRNHLLHTYSVRTEAGGIYKVFTPFWKACLQLPQPATPLHAPDHLNFGNATLPSDRLEDWRLTPTSPDWATGLRDSWLPGEHGTRLRMQDLLEKAGSYSETRDCPAADATSRLSPHLHFGEISPRQIWHDIRHFCEPSDRGAEAFVRQLYWRDFSHYLLENFPDLPVAPLRSEFARFPWRSDQQGLQAWQHGQTGYPMVDAGMRELWQTGWMHNRVRMLVASLLVKHLLIPWQEGAGWFRNTLVDADQANNSASWQWVAGCGTDAAPYFRIFNPVTQGRKFDPQGRYVKQWVPELERLDAAWVHAPWEAPASVLAQAGVQLGKNYPHAIVEHGYARERALAGWKSLRST